MRTGDEIVEPTLSVFGVVRRLREQRYCMVQATSQYEFIYEYILQWLKSKGFNQEKWHELLDKKTLQN